MCKINCQAMEQHGTVWKCILLSKRSQSGKHAFHVISSIQHFGKGKAVETGKDKWFPEGERVMGSSSTKTF